MSYLLDYNPGTQQWGYPRRGGAQLSGTCIIHTAECAADNVGDDTSAEGSANMIANRADYGSYHRLVDSDSIIDMLPWEYEAWQDSETNNWAVGISAAVRTTDWLVIPADRRERIYRNMTACAADFVNYMAGKGITVPLVRISGAQARARVPGFCAHGDSGIARTDPGAQFDWALFFRYTAESLGGGIQPQGTTTPKEWDEMASKEEIKEAIREESGNFWFSNSYGRPVQLWSILNAIDKNVNGNNDSVQSKLDRLIGETVGLRAAVAALSVGSSVTPEQVESAIKDALSDFTITLAPAKKGDE